MSSNEQGVLQASRLARRERIQRNVTLVRQLLAQRGYPVPDDTKDEEILVAAQYMVELTRSGSFLSPDLHVAPLD